MSATKRYQKASLVKMIQNQGHILQNFHMRDQRQMIQIKCWR